VPFNGEGGGAVPCGGHGEGTQRSAGGSNRLVGAQPWWQRAGGTCTHVVSAEIGEVGLPGGALALSRAAGSNGLNHFENQMVQKRSNFSCSP
jgi:hypothetical protein